MVERRPLRAPVALGVPRVVPLDLVRRGRRAAGVLQDERHLLGEPPAHDGVLDVEAQPLRLAIEDLLVHRVRDQRFQLRPGGRAAPLRRPAGVEAFDLVVGHLDHVALLPAAGRPEIEREHADAEQEEEHERVGRPPGRGGRRTLSPVASTCATIMAGVSVHSVAGRRKIAF